MDHTQEAYYPLKLGPVTVALRFRDEGFTEGLEEYFDSPRGMAEPDLYLDFSLVDHDEYPHIPESLIQAKKWHGDAFSIADALFTGTRGDKPSLWDIEVKRIMTTGQITRVFEQFLYQAFYSACKTSVDPSFLLHSSGVSVNGQGFLFTGPSGMGKSTIARLSREYDVLNDEMNIVSPAPDGGYRIHPCPFNAYFKGKAIQECGLRAVFLLSHDAECRIEIVSPAMAAAEITGQVVPPLGLEDTYTPAVAGDMLKIAMELVTRTPVYRLYFPVEGGFWPLILKEFALPR